MSASHDYLYSGERQVAARIQDVRPDHVARYLFAAGQLQPGWNVLDAGCTCGYGSTLLAMAGAEKVTGIDACEEAIDFAQAHWAHERVAYLAAWLPLSEPAIFDMIVAFEVIEHLEDDAGLLRWFHECLPPGGTLICSVPNRVVWPNHNSNKWHFRHYTPEEFAALLEGAGFTILERRSQASKTDYEIREGWEGRYLIAVCRKV